MSECVKCGAKHIGYMKYRCHKCQKEEAGIKPRKHRKLCRGCVGDFYNQKYPGKNPFGGKGCMTYASNNVIIKQVYYFNSQVVPDHRWKLECYNYKRS